MIDRQRNRQINVQEGPHLGCPKRNKRRDQDGELYAVYYREEMTTGEKRSSNCTDYKPEHHGPG